MTIQISRRVLLAPLSASSKKEFPKKYYELVLIANGSVSGIGVSPFDSLLVRRWGVINKINGKLRMSPGAVKIEKYSDFQLTTNAYFNARTAFLNSGYHDGEDCKLFNMIGEIPLDVSGNWRYFIDQKASFEIQKLYTPSRAVEICLRLKIAIPPRSMAHQPSIVVSEQIINSPEWGSW